MAELLGGRFLLLFSQIIAYSFNQVDLKSQANSRAGPGFPLDNLTTACIASQVPGWLSIRGIAGGQINW
jgi:hypothetical protein